MVSACRRIPWPGGLRPTRRTGTPNSKSRIVRGEINSFVSYVKPLPYCIRDTLVVALYITLGGLKAAAVTDALQGIVDPVFHRTDDPARAGQNRRLARAAPGGARVQFRLFGTVAASDYAWYSIFGITFTSMVQIFGLANNMSNSGSARDEKHGPLRLKSLARSPSASSSSRGCSAGCWPSRFFRVGWPTPENVWGTMSKTLLGPGLMGLMLSGMLLVKPAESALRKGLSLGSASAPILVLLAHALAKQGEAEEAERCLREALELNPEFGGAHDLLAFLLPQMGRFDEAKQHAHKAFELDPGNSAYLSRYVFSGKVTPTDRDLLTQLERMTNAPNLGIQEKIRVEYALGKAFEDLEDYRSSLKHFIRANSLSFAEQRKSGHNFSIEDHRREVDFLINAYSSEMMREQSSAGIANEVPVFIVGMMRSGTTLTEQILSSHPLVGGAGELDYWVRTAPNTVNAPPSLIRRTANQYLQLLQEIAPGKKRICDKMPQNYMSIGPIHVALPNARFIHCRRDPRDTCLSIFTIPFTHHPPSAYSMRNIASTYREYLRIMDHWRGTMPSDLFLEVDYEQLVENKEFESRRLIEFLGLEWSDACLYPEREQTPCYHPQQVAGASAGLQLFSREMEEICAVSRLYARRLEVPGWLLTWLRKQTKRCFRGTWDLRRLCLKPHCTSILTTCKP